MDKPLFGKTAILAAAGVVLAGAAPARAQQAGEDYRTIVTIMRACATIADIPARMACYDNTIAANTRTPAPQAAVPVAPLAGGFAAETLPQQREAQRAQQDDAVELAVTAVRQLQPGVAVLTLADGGQWRFVDAASFSYDMPARGQTVRLERGALGSFYLHFNGQRALRIQRVQ
jgi:hypothetical protein